jgi:cytochrome P450
LLPWYLASLGAMAVGNPSTTRTISDLPGPKGLPFVGSLFEIRLSRLHLVFEDWARIYGGVYAFRVGPKRALVVADPGLVDEVLRARPQVYRRIATVEPVFAELGMAGVFSAEGVDWRKQRRLVMQALTQRNLVHFFPLLRLTAERLLGRWQRMAASGQVLDVVAELRRFTTDVTTQLAFGYDVNTIERDGDRLQQNLSLIFPAINRRLNALVAHWRVVRLPFDRRVDRAVREVRLWLADLLQEARERHAADPAREAQPRNVLEAMLAARDDAGQPFSDEFILGNALQLLIAGEDTTAAAVAWAVHELCDKPELVLWLRGELDTVLADSAFPNELEACGQLHHAAAIGHEALRLSSVAPLQFVENNFDSVIGDVAVPRGTWIVTLTRLGGLDSQYFADPQAFRPERWLGLNPSGAHTPAAQMPFGSGPRICPGRALALLEMRFLLSLLYKNFELERVGLREDVEAHFAFTLEPRGLNVRLHPRAKALTQIALSESA